MAAKEIVDTPMTGPEKETTVSNEQVALTDFAYCLGSCNFTADSGIADEGSTRKEAKLLMSLLASTPPHLDEEVLQPVSSSESEVSYNSDSSYSRRETFSFTCPSLSLESSSSTSPYPRLLNLEPSQGRVSTTAMPTQTEKEGKRSLPSLETTMPLPAELLGRPLTVDDRDALRLSADAMARNVLQSFQKALDWRIQAWINAASKTLVRKEREMVDRGAEYHQVRGLLETSEAKLIVTLRAIADKVCVTGAGTSFRVLSQRIENDSFQSEEEPVQKKRRISTEPCDLEEGEYQYSVTHSLVFECVVNLQTPAGYSEITLSVPGIMDGTFLSSEPGAEELKSVVVELDTHILSAMVEKSCRTIVRTSVEAAMEPPPHVGPAEEEEAEEIEQTAATMTKNMKSPPRRNISEGTAEATAARATIVTPRTLCFDSLIASGDFPPNERVLLPIPDDFEKEINRPRQISPQPHSNSNSNSLDFNGSVPFTPRKNTDFSGPSLVSPAAEYEFLGGGIERGPSLPLLVEVACRAMRVD